MTSSLLLTLLTLSSLCVVLGDVHHTRPSPRVVLGVEVDQFTTHFYCTLYVEFEDDGGTAVCGCALIRDGVALTAAHCLSRADPTAPTYRQKPAAMYARLYGELNTSDGYLVRVDVGSVRVSQTYRFEDAYHDLAAFALPFSGKGYIFNNVTINTRRSAWDALTHWDRVHVVGVGLDRNEALSLGVPRETDLSRRSCSNPIGYGDLQAWDAVWYHDDICAGPFYPCEAGNVCADSCRGDSGGPLYQRLNNGTVIIYGVVSRGMEKCGVPGSLGGRPGIYTPLDTHRRFIEAVINGIDPRSETSSPSSDTQKYSKPFTAYSLTFAALAIFSTFLS